MEKNFSKIFWGYLIILLNINIGPINIFPNFVGYFLIVSGLEQINHNFDNIAINKAKKLSYWLLIYSIMAFIAKLAGVSYLDGNSIYDLIINMAYGLLVNITNLLMAFYILSGTIDLYILRGMEEHAQLIEKKQRQYTVLDIIGTFFVVLSLNISNEVFLGFVVVYVISVQVYLIVTISKIKISLIEV